MQCYSTQSFLHVRISSNLKQQAENLFRKMGMTSSSGVRMLLARFIVEGKHPTILPFVDTNDEHNDGVPEPPEPHFTEKQIEMEQRIAKSKHSFYK